MNGRRSRAFRAYQKVKTLKPARSLFDLSHEILMTCEMFKLYPCCVLEMSPGDTFHVANQSVTRLQPLNAPVLASITQSTHYFFVPYRILDENWTEFITGGIEGEEGGSSIGELPSETAIALPRWNPIKNGEGTLWDYCGFPTGVKPAGAFPLDYVRRAYNRIWNEYYRDENLQDEVPEDNEDILYRDWQKDYFTSALLGQQRGISPAMPVVGTAPISTTVTSVPGSFHSYASSGSMLVTFTVPSTVKDVEMSFTDFQARFSDSKSGSYFLYSFGSGSIVSRVGTTVTVRYYVQGIASPTTDESFDDFPFGNPVLKYSTSSVDFESSGAGFDVKDLRQAFQIQKWLELANRGGVRYTEFLRAFFGVSPRDDRLQRPEYIGGTKSPIVISEVLQTSSTENQPTPQGQMAGHGLGASRTFVGSYSAQEYGILMGLVSYTTPPIYTQGINKQWLRRSKYDFLFPQFTHLSEQAIEGAEVYATDNETENRKVWGFNEIYDELRSIPSRVVGKMRSTFNYWHLARFFNSKPALNADFVSGKDVSKRIFAVQSEEGIILDFANIIRAVRPIPKYGTPGGV